MTHIIFLLFNSFDLIWIQRNISIVYLTNLLSNLKLYAYFF